MDTIEDYLPLIDKEAVREQVHVLEELIGRTGVEMTVHQTLGGEVNGVQYAGEGEVEVKYLASKMIFYTVEMLVPLGDGTKGGITYGFRSPMHSFYDGLILAVNFAETCYRRGQVVSMIGEDIENMRRH